MRISVGRNGSNSIFRGLRRPPSGHCVSYKISETSRELQKLLAPRHVLHFLPHQLARLKAVFGKGFRSFSPYLEKISYAFLGHICFQSSVASASLQFFIQTLMHTLKVVRVLMRVLQKLPGLIVSSHLIRLVYFLVFHVLQYQRARLYLVLGKGFRIFSQFLDKISEAFLSRILGHSKECSLYVAFVINN